MLRRFADSAKEDDSAKRNLCVRRMYHVMQRRLVNCKIDLHMLLKTLRLQQLIFNESFN